MTLATMRGLTLQRVDESADAATATYTASQADAAINEGLQLFALLTLCVEKAATWNLTNGVAWYSMLAVFADWLLPLRITTSTGLKVRPSTLAELDALDGSWQNASGAVSRYVALGFDLVGLYRKPTGGSLTVTYAAAPAGLTADGHVPAIPEEYHPALVDYAVYRIREGLGGSEFKRGLGNLADFLEAAKKLNRLMRTRALALRYDKLPFEIERYDLSKLLTIRKDLLPARKETPEWST